MVAPSVQRTLICPACGRAWHVQFGVSACPNCGVLGEPRCACGCSESLDGLRVDAVYRSEAHAKSHLRAGRPDRHPTNHPLVEARAEQEAPKLNSELGDLVYQAIIDYLRQHGKVFVDDLEGYFPPEHEERCRRLVPGQLGSLRGRRYIQPTREYRKSAVPARKGGKSWVYEFTRLGREKLTAGVGVGGPSSQDAGTPPCARTGRAAAGIPTASADPGEQSAAQGDVGDPSPKGTDRPRQSSPTPPVPSADITSTQDSPGQSDSRPTGKQVADPGESSVGPEHEPLSLLPEPDPEAWAA